MNKLIIGAATLLFAAAPALAQTAQPAGVFIKGQTAEEYLAKDHLIGTKVQGPDGKIIGDIEDLIITDGNQVVGIVMGTGGFLGMGEKPVGVYLSALKFDEKDGKLTVTLPQGTVENLAALEPFQRQHPKKSLLERAQEKARELSDKTSATTKSAIEQAQPAIEEAKKKAQEAYEAAKEAAQPAYEKAKEAVEGAIEAAKPETPAPVEPAPAPVEPAPAPAEPAPTTPTP